MKSLKPTKPWRKTPIRGRYFWRSGKKTPGNEVNCDFLKRCLYELSWKWFLVNAADAILCWQIQTFTDTSGDFKSLLMHSTCVFFAWKGAIRLYFCWFRCCNKITNESRDIACWNLQVVFVWNLISASNCVSGTVPCFNLDGWWKRPRWSTNIHGTRRLWWNADFVTCANVPRVTQTSEYRTNLEAVLSDFLSGKQAWASELANSNRKALSAFWTKALT